MSNYDNEYDLVCVFKVGDKQKKSDETEDGVAVSEFDHFQTQWALFVGYLEKANLKFRLYKGQNESHVFCEITVPDGRLKQEAERVAWDLELDPQKSLEKGKELSVLLALRTEEGDEAKQKDTNLVPQNLWHNLYGPYQSNDAEYKDREDLYGKHGKTPFRTTDRLKLLYIILESERRLNGCNLALTTLLADSKHPLVAYYPFHEKDKLDEIERKTTRLNSLCDLPLKLMRDYFGEQIGFYFAFLQYYTKYLLIPSFFGIITFIWQLVQNKQEIVFLPIFGVIVCLWATIFLELWKRRESILRGHWGMGTFAQKEQPRPNFYGDIEPSPIDGTDEQYYPFKKRLGKCLASHSIVFTMIVIVISIIFGLLWMRSHFFTRYTSETRAGIIGSVCTSFFIIIMNVIYGKLATWLNDWENHKTDTEYENSKIAKTFMFKFVNSYYSCFYIAFIQVYDSKCPKGDSNCMRLLQRELGIVFATQIIVKNILELGIPMIKRKISLKKHGNFEDVSVAESDFYSKEEYGSTLEDFDEITIQYGYATLFVIAFPITPLFALLNNLIENALDSYNLCHDYRRPEPRGAYDIGTWSSIFEILGYITVVFNVALLTISGFGPHFLPYSRTVKFIVFVSVEHFLFIIKFAIAYFVPDEPLSETYRLQRQNYLSNVLVRGMPVQSSDSEDDEQKYQSEKNKQSQVTMWLTRHKMEKYVDKFKEYEIKTFETDNIDELIKNIGVEEKDIKIIRAKFSRNEQRKGRLVDKYKFDNIPTSLEVSGDN